MAGLFFFVSVNAQLTDSLPVKVINLDDVSIVEFKIDNSPVFKNKDLSVNAQANKVSEDIGDLLQNTIPVYFKNYSVGGVKTIDFRGTGAERTMVYWNGIPVNSPTLGGFDFSLLPYYFVEDARLRFGGASLTDGGGGLGGSVQLLNPAGFEKNKLEFTGALGSFGSYTLAGKALLRKGKFKSDTRVLYKTAKNDYTFTNDFKKGQPTENRVHNEVVQFGFQEVMSFQFNQKHLLSARLILTESDRNLPPPVSSSNRDGAWQKDNLFLSQIAWDWLMQNEMYLKIRTGFQNQLNRYVQQDVIDAQTMAQGWNNNLNFGYNGFNNLLLNTSLRYDKYWVNSDGVGNVQEDQFTGSLNVDWQLIQQLKLVLGARLTTITGSSSPLMPYGGLSWKISEKGGSIQANVSQVYRFPTINDRYWNPGGNPDLEPENGWNYELGYTYLNNFGKFEITSGLTGFYSMIHHWILWQPSENNPFIWNPENIWRVNVKGLELNYNMIYHFSQTSNMVFGFNYTLTSSTVVESNDADDNVVGNQLILTPEHQVFMPVEFRFKSFSSAVNYQFVSKRYTDRLNNISLESFNLLDLVFGYYFDKPAIQFRFHIDNILNTQYQTVPGQPLPGINFNFELTWKIF
jgi:iron complex outermembrane receptor protein